MVEEKEISNHRKTSCFICRQPVVEYNRFTVSWSESGEEISRVFCGSRCLRDWAEEYSENIKLNLFDEETEDFGMYHNVSAANLQTCLKCGSEYAMTLQECPRCGSISAKK